MRIKYLLLFLLTFSTYFLSGQPWNITGKVVDKDLVGLPGVNVYDQDTTLITTTDLDGNFALIIFESTLLQFGAVGMEWEYFWVSRNCSTLEVIMLVDVIYHYKSHKKIDKLRKEDFDHRMKLHQQAFEQEVFESVSPCFDYTFIQIKPKLDEIREWMNNRKNEIREEFNQLSIGDAVYVPYSGPITSSVHSGYSNYVDYDCLIRGTVLKRDKKRRGFNILYQVIDMDDCIYEKLTHNDQIVKVGDSIKYNMRHFRLITAYDMR